MTWQEPFDDDTPRYKTLQAFTSRYKPLHDVATRQKQILSRTICRLSAGTDDVRGKFNNVVNSVL